MKRTALKRKTELRRTSGLSSHGKLERKSPPKRPKPISPASKGQREKAKEALCPVTGFDRHEATIDPAHLWPRGKGGCDDELCVIGLAREAHRAFDEGELDLLPYIRPSGDERRYLPEILHMLDHADGDLLGVLHRLTGERFVPQVSLPASRRGGS